MTVREELAVNEGWGCAVDPVQYSRRGIGLNESHCFVASDIKATEIDNAVVGRPDLREVPASVDRNVTGDDLGALWRSNGNQWQNGNKAEHPHIL